MRETDNLINSGKKHLSYRRCFILDLHTRHPGLAKHGAKELGVQWKGAIIFMQNKVRVLQSMALLSCDRVWVT